MRYVQVDPDTAQRFFEAGGMIHLHAPGYSLAPTQGISKGGKFKSIKHGLAYFANEEGLNNPEMLIDQDDEHPANPFKTGEMKVIRPE